MLPPLPPMPAFSLVLEKGFLQIGFSSSSPTVDQYIQNHYHPHLKEHWHWKQACHAFGIPRAALSQAGLLSGLVRILALRQASVWWCIRTCLFVYFFRWKVKVKVLPKLTFVSVPRRPTPTLEPFHIGETVPVCNGEVRSVNPSNWRRARLPLDDGPVGKVGRGASSNRLFISSLGWTWGNMWTNLSWVISKHCPAAAIIVSYLRRDSIDVNHSTATLLVVILGNIHV